MSAILERADEAGLQPAPITFDAPPLDAGCPGKWRPFKSCFVSLCHKCARFGKPGQQIVPAARIPFGGATCINYLAEAEAGVHGANVLPVQSAGKPQVLGAKDSSSTQRGER